MSDGYNCVACKRRNDAEDMVECTKCKNWLHFSCAEVDSSVEERDWFCKDCMDLNPSMVSDKTVAQAEKASAIVHLKKTSGSKINYLRSNRSKTDVKSIASSSRSRRGLKLELLRLEEHKKIEDKFLEEREKKEKEFIQRKFELLTLEAEAEDELDENISMRLSQTRAWVEKSKNVFGHTEKPEDSPEESHLQLRPTSNLIEQSDFLDQRQIAARQVMAKDLPMFSGRPEEWPLFISSFENDTKLCGFSNHENLSRLQRALRGRALEAVGSRLMMPSNVPEVIETLRMLYGQPEYIVDNILKKIRTEPGPKAERLDTLISFALSVRSVHCMMEASGLTHYLSNRTLLKELVEKLPATLKLNWAMTIDGSETLTTFSDWLYKMAQAASKVTTCAVADTKIEKRQSHLHAHSENQFMPKNSSQFKNTGCYLCGKDHKLVKCDTFCELSVKKRWDLVSNQSICESCLSHPSKFKCRKQAVCGVNGCTSKHHHLMHGYRNESNESGPVVGCYEHQSTSSNDMLFSIIPVTLHGKGKSLETFAFLDNGSSLTLVEEEVANSLGLDGIPKELCLKWTADTVRFEKESKIVPLEISGDCHNSGPERYSLRDVRTVKKLALPLQSIDQVALTEKYPHLREIPLRSYNQAKCGILIGINNQKLLLAQKLREGSFDEPVAFKTRLGWCVTGSNIKESKEYGVYHACDCNKDLHEIVRQHYILEDYGVEKTLMKSTDEIRATQILEQTIKREKGAFKSGLFWRYNDVFLPNSYPMALKRHRCLEKKVTTDINSKGYARMLSSLELKEHCSRVWYLPAFMVENRNKLRKVRMVLDGAALSQGTSLNDMQLKGPDELTVLTDVLHSLRLKKISIAGKIEEMFLQVRIREEDQDCLRFLWSFGNINSDPKVFKMLVLPFGLRCSPSFAQHVKNKNAKSYAKTYPEAANIIIKHHYVDDMLYSAETVEDAIQIAKEIKHIHSKGGFNIRNWVSNSTEVLQALNQSDNLMGKSFQDHLNETNSTTKVLGLWWSTSEDTFIFSLKLNKGHVDVLNGIRIPTKRELLRVFMSVFDPLTTNEEVDLLEQRPQYILHTGNHFENKLVQYDRFSKWKRLFRSMAYCLRYINNIKPKRLNLPKRLGLFSSQELLQAEKPLIRMTQRDSYADELAMLNFKVLPKSSHLYKCSPYIDSDGILRINERIDRACFLIVDDYHQRFYHQCQETIVNKVRQRFWIPSLRTLFRSVRTKCPVCKIKSAIPLCPEMAPLPKARLAAFVRPFTYTGIDYLGPILVHSERKTEKRWGVLFTCLTIRAVHIELAHSLTADSCILCIGNFMARRATPSEIYSDNDTNFKGAEKELRETFSKMNKEIVKSRFISAETKWFFKPPAAPHMGGCWERLVRSVKNVLKEVLKKQRLKDESLMASLIEDEGIINSRPLTHVPVESQHEEALTPYHFLMGSASFNKFCDEDLLLRKSWRISQKIANLFWKRWIKEYLPTLTRRTNWYKNIKNLEGNDIVMIVDENLPRGSWPKGIVIRKYKKSKRWLS